MNNDHLVISCPVGAIRTFANHHVYASPAMTPPMTLTNAQTHDLSIGQPTPNQRLTNGQSDAQPTINPIPINDNSTGKQCGRGEKMMVRQIGNCNNMITIQSSTPASPLQTIDQT